MSLRSTITGDLTHAMKNKDAETVRTLRLVSAAFLNLEKSKNTGTEITDDEYMTVLKREYKSRNESLAVYEQGGRMDTVAEIKREMEIISRYLPAQMPDAEVEVIIRRVIESLDDKSIGSIMKAVMPELKNKADGKKINEIVQKVLNS